VDLIIFRNRCTGLGHNFKFLFDVIFGNQFVADNEPFELRQQVITLWLLKNLKRSPNDGTNNTKTTYKAHRHDFAISLHSNNTAGFNIPTIGGLASHVIGICSPKLEFVGDTIGKATLQINVGRGGGIYVALIRTGAAGNVHKDFTYGNTSSTARNNKHNKSIYYRNVCKIAIQTCQQVEDPWNPTRVPPHHQSREFDRWPSTAS
jgi:hypothetical protein